MSSAHSHPHTGPHPVLWGSGMYSAPTSSAFSSSNAATGGANMQIPSQHLWGAMPHGNAGNVAGMHPSLSNLSQQQHQQQQQSQYLRSAFMDGASGLMSNTGQSMPPNGSGAGGGHTTNKYTVIPNLMSNIGHSPQSSPPMRPAHPSTHAHPHPLTAYLPSSLLSPRVPSGSPNPSGAGAGAGAGGSAYRTSSVMDPASGMGGRGNNPHNLFFAPGPSETAMDLLASQAAGGAATDAALSKGFARGPVSSPTMAAEQILKINLDLDTLSRQRIMIEERLRQVNLNEQTILLDLLKARPDALTPELVHYHLDILATHETGCERLITVVDHLQNSARGMKGLDLILTEVCKQAHHFATDRNGSRALISLLPRCRHHHIELLMQTLQPRISTLACDNIGHGVILVLIEHVANEEGSAFRDAITLSLRAHVRELVVDMNGSSVIRTCLERWNSKDVHFILIALIAHCRELSCTRFGGEVLQRAVCLCTDAQRHIFANEILSSFHDLICDPCGNYVVQHFLDMNLPSFSAECARSLIGQVGVYATHKFASNVVERCIRAAPPELFQVMYDELLHPNALPRLLLDKYGNYVVQTAVATATPSQRETAKERLLPILHLVHNTACGRKLLQRLGATLPSGGGSGGMGAGGRGRNARQVDAQQQQQQHTWSQPTDEKWKRTTDGAKGDVTQNH